LSPHIGDSVRNPLCSDFAPLQFRACPQLFEMSSTFLVTDRLRPWRLRRGGMSALLLAAIAMTGSGCGTMKSNTATEQLLYSSAVDAAVAKIDFTPLRGELVYFDTQYIKTPPNAGGSIVGADYVISSLRQQMAAAGVLLVPKLEDADYVVEGRLGTLGLDSNEVVYGLPANSLNAAATAAANLAGVSAAPNIPEMSFGRRNAQSGAAKIGVFAYDRVTREAVWQSGISIARATARDMWLMGVGPYQKGTIYNGKTKFAGEAEDTPIASRREGFNGPIAGYKEETIFPALGKKAAAKIAREEKAAQEAAEKEAGQVLPAGHEKTSEN